MSDKFLIFRALLRHQDKPNNVGKVFNALNELQPCSVTDLIIRTRLPQEIVSQALSRLRAVDWAKNKRNGKERIYRITPRYKADAKAAQKIISV